MTKVSKIKYILFVAGFCRHSCWFLKWAKMLATQRDASYDGASSFMFPSLNEAGAPNTRLGDMVELHKLNTVDPSRLKGHGFYP